MIINPLFPIIPVPPRFGYIVFPESPERIPEGYIIERLMPVRDS